MTAKTLAKRFKKLSGRKSLSKAQISECCKNGGAENILRMAMPDLFAELEAENGKPSTIEALKSSGENFVFWVGDKHIAKIKYFAEPVSVVRETLLQELLSERIEGGIVPRVTHISEKYHAFAMERLEGRSYNDAGGQLTEEQQSVLDADFIKFTKEAAKAISLEESVALKLPARWENANSSAYNELNGENLTKLTGRLADNIDLIEEALSDAGFTKGKDDPRAQKFLERLKEAYQLSFRREDMHGGNVLIDPETGHMTGMIDFGYASIVPKYHIEQKHHWRVGHRHLQTDDHIKVERRSDAELVSIAEEVSRKYSQDFSVPKGDEWLNKLEKWIEPPEGGLADRGSNPTLKSNFKAIPNLSLGKRAKRVWRKTKNLFD